MSAQEPAELTSDPHQGRPVDPIYAERAAAWQAAYEAERGAPVRYDDDVRVAV